MVDRESLPEIPLIGSLREKDKIYAISLIVGVVALMGTIVFGVLYFMSGDGQDALAAELAARQDKLASYQSVSSLEEQLAVVEDRLEDVRAAHEAAKRKAEQAYSAGGLNNGSVLESVLAFADRNNIDVKGVITEPTVVDIETGTQGGAGSEDLVYHRLEFEIEIEGSLTNIGQFINDLENGNLKIVLINNIEISDEVSSYAATVNFSVTFPNL